MDSARVHTIHTQTIYKTIGNTIQRLYKTTDSSSKGYTRPLILHKGKNFYNRKYFQTCFDKFLIEIHYKRFNNIIEILILFDS